MYVRYGHSTVWKEMTCSTHGSEEEGMQHELQVRKGWGTACGVSGEDGQDMQHTSQERLMFRNLNYED